MRFLLTSYIGDGKPKKPAHAPHKREAQKTRFARQSYREAAGRTHEPQNLLGLPVTPKGARTIHVGRRGLEIRKGLGQGGARKPETNR